ncbi:MAG TPA: aspartate aminotransferase family protein [Chloroflexota bacterium]
MGDLYERAQRVLPGGVTAAARVNSALGRPFYVSRAEGPYLYDLDGKRFAETSMSNGASLLGHGHPRVVAAVQRALELGIACMADGEPQVGLAERLVEQVPCLEMVRFTTTGTEATLYTARIARAYTGRPKLLKFAGHFHGFNDHLAFNFPRVGDAARALRPETEGMTPGAGDGVLLGEFNDLEGTRRRLAEHGHDLAAVVLEPIAYDMGAVPPAPGFLEMLRDETARRGIVLVFDEILSGYRTGPTCAQGHLGVTPDLCTLGKAIGGGVPLSAFGGRRELMGVVTPLGPAAHTGTYNAHLIPVLAAHAFLDAIEEEGFWEHLLGLHARLYAGLDGAFRRAGLPVRVQGIGARFGLYFGLDPDRPVGTYRQAAGLDRPMMDAFGREMLARGVYFNPAWHHGISALHTEALVDEICAAAEASGRAVAAELAATG